MKSGITLLTLLLVGCGAKDENSIRARGTIEIPEIDLAAPMTSRVVSIQVEEGAAVQVGDTIALLSQAELPASIASSRAQVSAAAANVADLEAGARPEELRRAEAESAAAGEEAKRAAQDLERARALYAKQVIAKQQLDAAETAARVAEERARVAAQALSLLKAGSRQDRIRAAKAQLSSAQSQLRMLEARATDLVLIAPVAGTILSRQAEPGEVLPAGVPAVTIGEMSRPWIRVYVPAKVMQRLALGQEARVTVDGTDTPMGKAKIVSINTEAEFTPRVALTERERADLLFGIKLELLPGESRWHPGLWATVDFQPAAP